MQIQTKSRTKTLVITTLDTSQLKNYDYENNHGINPSYLMIGEVIDHIDKKK